MQKMMRRLLGNMMAPMLRIMMKKPAHNLISMLNNTEEIEYTCDEAYEVLDLYAEIVSRGDDPGEVMPLVKRHLDLCDNCREEFEALLAALETVGT